MAGEKLDPHERPPSILRDLYKFYQKLPQDALESASGIIDLSQGFNVDTRRVFTKVEKISADCLLAACCQIGVDKLIDSDTVHYDTQVYEAKAIRGLKVIPSLFPEEAQIALLSKLLHRDLADERHKTNVHLHYHLPYRTIDSDPSAPAGVDSEVSQASFFNLSPECPDLFTPLDDGVHKAFTISQFLNRKLRWVTLGGQYDWSQKRYPSENPPFPADIAAFTSNLFPEMKAEAAIVNVYTPGDTLSIHRDVSEECDQSLVSVSIGCDALFVIGIGSWNDRDSASLVLRLRSGDAVVMSKDARFAWHGVPQILPNTCPEWLRSWPAQAEPGTINHKVSNSYEAWRDWMSSKRINLNIRQMKTG